jgi:hypothetical protein
MQNAISTAVFFYLGEGGAKVLFNAFYILLPDIFNRRHFYYCYFCCCYYIRNYKLNLYCHYHRQHISLIILNKGYIFQTSLTHYCDLIQNSKLKLYLCWTNKSLRHEDMSGSGCIDPCFLDINTARRWLVSFIPWLLYPRGKSHRCPLDGRMGRPQHGEEKILVLTGTRTSPPRSSSP